MGRFNVCLNREPFPGAGRPWTYILSINMNVTVIYRKRHLFDHVNTKTSNQYIVPLSRSCECTHNAKFPVSGDVVIAVYVSLCFCPFCSYDYKWTCTDLAMGRQGSQEPPDHLHLQNLETSPPTGCQTLLLFGIAKGRTHFVSVKVDKTV